MDLSAVRQLANSWAPQFFRAEVRTGDLDDIRLVRGLRIPDRPIQLEVTEGGRPGDFLWNDLNLLIASARAICLFEDERFTGYSVYPVAVSRKGQPIAGYSGVSVVGRGGPLDERKSRVEWSIDPDGNRDGIKAVDGLWFDPVNWDGSDLFTVDEFAKAYLIVERAWKAMVRSKLTNFKPRPLNAFEFGYPRVRFGPEKR